MRVLLAIVAVVSTTAAMCQPLTPGYRRPTMPPQHMACIIPAAPPFQGMTCPSKSGVRGSPCQCGDLPYPGYRDFVRF